MGGNDAAGYADPFTVSASDDVTFLTFRTTCSGVQTFSDLSIRIASPPPPIRPGPPGFSHAAGSPEEYMQLTGWFPSGDSASGILIFANYPGCGNTGTNWTATRR
jgi:hypothetical protein